MIRRELLCLLTLLVAAPSHAQTPPEPARADSASIDDAIRRLLDEQPGRRTSERLVEHLTHLASDPLDVNVASRSDLSRLPFLSVPHANRIVRYRAQHGPFSSLDALTKVDGVSPELLARIRRYLTASDARERRDPYPSPPSFRDIVSGLEVEFVQRATRRLDLGRGFSDDPSRTTFQGSPLGLTTRLRLHHDRRIQGALTLDKDPGEAFRWAPERQTYGYDHVAGHLALQDVGRIQSLIIGNYTAEFGQGLALWQGLTFGKGRDPVGHHPRSGAGLHPFNSTSENEYFRGLAATLSLTPALSVSGFVSRRQRDASLDSTAGGPPLPARTLSTSGLHRTPSEVARKGTFGTTTVGGGVMYRFRGLHVGVSGYHSTFDRPLAPRDQPHRLFDPSGTDWSVASTYATAYLDEYTVFGEVGRSQNGAVGGLVGATLDHGAGIEALILGRRYPPDFTGLFGGAFGTSGPPQNEVGVYTGLRVRVAENWWVGGYVDQYRFPWLRFGVPRPTTGLDARLVVEATPRPWLSSYVQVRSQRDPSGTTRRGPHGRTLSGIRTEQRYSARWHVDYDFSDALTLRTRIEGTRFEAEGQAPTHGILFFQGLGVRPHPTVTLNARFGLFDTDGFQSRIYTYEHDLLYSFSVPALFGQGQRSYLHVRFRPTSALTLEAKYGVTWHPNRRTTGSGLNERDTNQVRDVRVQVRWFL